jgi:hypothetical protein
VPVLAGIPPEALKRVLERNGYKVIDEDMYNWLLAKGEDGEPVVVPKIGRVLGVDMMGKAHSIARSGGFGNDLIGEVHTHVSGPDRNADLDVDEEEDETPSP